MSSLDPYLKAVGRVLLAAIFLQAGIGKITSYAGTAQYMESQGIPGIMLPLVIALEVLGGLAIIVGWQTRWASLALAGFCIASAVLFHFDPGNKAQMINFMKNVAMAGGFLVLAAAGPGAFALGKKGA